MANNEKRLKDLAVKQAKPKEKPYYLPDGGSLFLLVKPNGGKYWHWRYRFDGKQKPLALGTYPDVTLEQARDKAIDARRLVKAGIDPGEVKKQTKLAKKETKQKEVEALLPPAPVPVVNSFEQVAREWLDARRETLRPVTAARALNYLEKDIFPDLGGREITEIQTHEILQTVRKVQDRGAYDVASRELQNIGRIFTFAIRAGIAKHNPANELSGALKKRPLKNRPALKLADLPVFLERLRESTANPVTCFAVKLCVLTFCRPETIRHARWQDFDLERREWRVPAEFMKIKTVGHIVPLSVEVLALLEELRPLTGHHQWLFPGERVREKPISDGTMNMCINRMGYQGLATPSGFRTTACSFLNESGFNRDAIERQMAHMERNNVRAAYIHHAEFLEERHRLMVFWGDYIHKLESASNVVKGNFRAG